MDNDLLKIDPAAETVKITSFIKTTLKEQGFENIVIGLSGGIDSAVSLSLIEKSIPSQNIFVAHLYYFESQINSLQPLLKSTHSAGSGQTNIPQRNICNISIRDAVDQIKQTIGLTEDSPDYKVRLGNIMARVRMIILYDLAKKHNALVCGTENKSEHYLGYFTLFGDSASDFEPIRHLYKTQIYELAEYLKIPEKIISLPPSAGLWAGQTDEKDFGFSYAEADRVLNLYFDQKQSLSGIIKRFTNAKNIVERVEINSFKHVLPYIL
jgi:NAD+ synthase